jgi:serine/threonine protein kinase/class 3 adenylate cyclase
MRTVSTGSKISHYRILEKLGEGGMGVLYKADDIRLKRRVALKFVRPDLTRQPKAKERLFREAQTTSRLDHPNTCTVFEIGETDEGQLYIVMPYYDGTTLRTRLERGRLSLGESVSIVRQIAEGLSAAHEQGVVHRDIKPENILLTHKGQVKILDFGIAKMGGGTTQTTGLTTLGTLLYMSPEQARIEKTDARSDLFSMAVVFYEMLTGEHPFKADHHLAILYAIAHLDPPLPSDLNPEITPELEELVFKSLAKEPEHRIATASEFLSLLPAAAPHWGDTPTPPIVRPHAGRAHRKRTRKTKSGSQTILIVEDDPSIAFGIKELLEAESYRALVAADGKTGLDQCLSIMPDLILLDIQLPSMNGLEVCRQVRANGFASPIVMLTSKTDNIDKVVGLEVGADDYITKPFDAHELLARIRANLRQHVRVTQKPTQRKDTHARRLATVMFTDMKDFAKKMNRDETSAIRQLKVHNQKLERAIRKFGGEVVEVIGDAFFVSFGSATKAVNCAIAIQHDLRNHNKNRVAADKILVRIGLHLGEVTHEGDRLRGNTVNIAARLQQLAPAGAILTSKAIYDAVHSSLNVQLVRLGAKDLKNIKEQVVTYRIKL